MANAGVISVEVQAKTSKFMSALQSCNSRVNAFANNLETRVGGTDYFAPLRESIQSTSRDLKQIVQGIVLAQSFYRVTNAIQSAISAVWDYTDALNQAYVAFGNLFDSASLASEFVAVMQDYAASSPFDFADVKDAATDLKAYGIEAENLMFVIEGIGNLAAVTGDYSTTFSRVARAIGQINTRGKLMSEEMRQLAEAGLNVDAVYEKLGISADDVADANIDAATAINAIVDVLNEDYAGAVDAANTTVSGMLSNIKDMVLQVTSGILDPVYEGVRGMLYSISQEVDQFQDYFKEGGLSYAIEQMFGSEALNAVYNFLKIMAQLGHTLMQVLVPALRILAIYGQAIITVVTALLGVIMPILTVIGTLANAILNNTVAFRVLQAVLLGVVVAFTAAKIAALGMMVVQAVSKIIAVLSTVLQAVTAAQYMFNLAMASGATMSVAAGVAYRAFASALNVNPIILAVTAVLALVAAFVGLRSILGGVSDITSSMSSFDPENFLGSIQPASGDLSKFNNRLSDTNSELDDLADGLEDAGDAADDAVEGLLSFDEVFSLPEANDSATSSSGLDGIGDISSSLGDLDLDTDGFNIDTPVFNWEDLFPTYDELQNVWSNIVSWFTSLPWSKVASAISSGLIAAISTIGFDTILTALSTVLTSGFSKTTWTSLSEAGVWSGLAKGIKNGIKASILSLGLEFVFEMIEEKLRESGNTMAADLVDAVSSPVASAIAVGITTKNPFAAAGALIASALFQSIETGIETGDWSSTVTNSISMIGLVFNKYSANGSKTGTFLAVGATITSLIFSAISTNLDSQGQTEAASTANKVGTVISLALSGASIGAAFGPVGVAVGAAVGGILGTILAFGEDIANWWTGTAWPWLSDLGSKIGDGLSDAWEDVSDFFEGIPSAVQGFFSGAGEWLSGKGTEIMNGLGSAASSGWSTVSSTFSSIPSKVSGFFSGAGTLLSSAGSNIVNGLKTYASNKWTSAQSTFSGIPSKIGNFFSNSGSLLRSSGSSIIAGLKSAASSGWSTASSVFSNIPTKIRNMFSNAGNWLVSAGKNLITGFANAAVEKFNAFLKTVSGWASKIAKIKGPESYDRRVLRPNGEWIMSGLEDSMTGRFPVILDAMHGLGEKMSEAFASGAPTVEDLALQSASSNYGLQYATAGSASGLDTVGTVDSTDTSSSRPKIYVKTLIASKQSLRELKKEFDIVAAEEDRWS